MKLTFRLVALVSVLASAYAGSSLLTACSSGGGTTDAGADAAKEGGTKDAGIKDTGGGGDVDTDSGPAPFIDPLCTAPNTPSGGACIADAGFGCNPITNVACKTDAGEACDFGGNDFQCYPPPPPNTQALCATCDDQNTACLPGSTCVNSDSQGTMKCAKFCCDDNDCSGGHCDNTTLSGGQQTPFGFCTK